MPSSQTHSIYSDMYKDAYGFRPRHVLDTEEQYRVEMEGLQGIIEMNIEDERQAQQEALEEFENELNDMVTTYGIDRYTAIRWSLQAGEVEIDDLIDVEHHLWKQGISFEQIDRYLNFIKDNQ